MRVEVISGYSSVKQILFFSFSKKWVKTTKPLQLLQRPLMDPAPLFENHSAGLQELADIQQSLHNNSSFSNFKHEQLNGSNKQIVGLNLLHGHFWQRSPLSDSSWTLHRANSGTACTKTWPRSEASPYINPDGIGFPRHLLTAFTHTKHKVSPPAPITNVHHFYACFHQNYSADMHKQTNAGRSASSSAWWERN